MLVGEAILGVDDRGEAFLVGQRVLELVMVTSAALELFSLVDDGVDLRLGVVEVSNAALGDHGLDFALQNALEAGDEVDLEAVGILEDRAVEEDLVRLAEVELQLVPEGRLVLE